MATPLRFTIGQCLPHYNACSTTDTCPLLSLPGEIRNAIYDACFQDSRIKVVIRTGAISHDVRIHQDSMYAAGVLQTCRQVRSEAINNFYSHSTFIFTMEDFVAAAGLIFDRKSLVAAKDIYRCQSCRSVLPCVVRMQKVFVPNPCNLASYSPHEPIRFASFADLRTLTLGCEHPSTFHIAIADRAEKVTEAELHSSAPLREASLKHIVTWECFRSIPSRLRVMRAKNKHVKAMWVKWSLPITDERDYSSRWMLEGLREWVWGPGIRVVRVLPPLFEFIWLICGRSAELIFYTLRAWRSSCKASGSKFRRCFGIKCRPHRHVAAEEA